MATLSSFFIQPVQSIRGIGFTYNCARQNKFTFNHIFMVTKTVVDLKHNLLARSCCLIRGDDEEVEEILASSWPRKRFLETEANLTASFLPEAYLDIHWRGQTIRGNNHQVLLEQLEHAGIRIPYSCRAGICGCCRIKLVDGKVSTLKKTTLGENDMILCCICVPQTSVQLAPIPPNTG